ncbi:PilZ domain-containing protein [Marinobacter sp. DUT-3]|uniref:PilZ domain-containing protein n=1 Tax=unclassified Marinobacter TaxID=83889 RepID=UPI00387B03FB
MSDVDYNFGNNEDVPAGKDSRGDYRLFASAYATLELDSGMPGSSGGPSSGARILECRIRDLSVGGLCLVTSLPVTTGALLSASVTLGRGHSPFQFTVEVVWCHEGSPGEWLVGIRIQESDDTSYLDWVEAVSKVMVED